MTIKFGEQLLEHRLSLITRVQQRLAGRSLTDAYLVRIGLSYKVKVHPALDESDRLSKKPIHAQ